MKSNPVNKTKNPKEKKQIARTTQQTIPYIDAYENGVLYLGDFLFNKSWEYEDISFKTSSDEQQETIYSHYMNFLNTINPGENITFSFINEIEDSDEKIEKISPILRGDALDTYRKEKIEILKDKAINNRNSISTKKYMSATIKSDDVNKAMQRMFSLGAELDTNFRKVTKHPIKELKLPAKLELLHTILNSTEKNYWFEHDKEGNVSVDFARMAKQGLTTKDIIAPDNIKFYRDHFEINGRVGQAMYLDNLANWMNTNFLSDLCAINFESVISLQIQAIPQDEAQKLVHNQLVNITAEVIEKQEKSKNPEFISVDLKKAKEQIDLLQNDIMNRDQKLFYMSLTLVHFADNLEKLREQTRTIKNVGNKYLSSIKTLGYQQERGFVSTLPLGINKTFVNRLLTTESLGLFLPFDEVNQFDEGGLYYGVNAINKSLIVCDRTKGQNFNGLVLGSSGSGKSLSSKAEMGDVCMMRDDYIYVIDPQGEYIKFANSFQGSVIKIAPGNGVYINPLDLDIDTTYDSEYNPLAMKIDFICGILETMLGTGAKLTPTQKSIVDRCVHQIYMPYFEHLNELPLDANGKKRTIDREHCPTLQNLFETLLQQTQIEAQNLALVMETYTTGSFDTFAHRTNVDLSNKLIVYDISNIGTNLKELALKVCTNDVWLKMMQNRRENRYTWFYLDEFHLLLSNDSTAEFLKTIWKCARKFLGVPTGLTQNVEDLLLSPAARAIINNSSFVYMLNQSAMDRSMLQDILHLSDNDVEFITNAERGHGLIYNGKQAIPFENDFPTNTQLYKIYSSKPEDTIE